MASFQFVGCCLCFILMISISGAIENPVVTTTLGKIRGTTLSIPDHDKKAYAFLNVPYVAPPVGELRFQPPQPMEPWEGIKETTEKGAPCPQLEGLIDQLLEAEFGLKSVGMMKPVEDCLHLNVYTPALSGKRPVMVFIHGGGLAIGWASSYDMRVYAIREDIVGVTIQYRLGALGWLSTGDDEVQGNMGFLDQVAALQWVQANIARFGGDPNQVTIFGESAGSWSVSMHLLSPMSNGLFHRGIMQSGSIVDTIFTSPPADDKATAEKLGSLLGCPSGGSAELVTCLRQKSPEEILKPEGATEIDLASLMFLPKVGDKCFPKDPCTLLEEGEYNSNVDMMVGVNEVEGYMIGKTFNPALSDPDFNSTQFRTSIDTILGFGYPKQTDQWEAMADVIMDVYAADKKGDALKKAYTELVGDFFISKSTYRTVLELAKNSHKNVFFYQFEHRPEIAQAPDYVKSDHGYELIFAFGTSYMTSIFEAELPEFKTDDKVVEGLVMNYWANFARTGNPNGEGQPKWPEFKDNDSFLVITTNPTIGQSYQPARMNLWLKTLPELVQKSTGKDEL